MLAERVRQAAILNNQGAACFSSGNLSDAAEILEKAKMVIMSILNPEFSNNGTSKESVFGLPSSAASMESVPSPNSCLTFQNSSCCQSSTRLFQPQSNFSANYAFRAHQGFHTATMPNPCYACTDIPVPNLFHDQFYVCNKVIVISSPAGIAYASQSLEHSLAFCKTIITFNVAMILHWKGKVTRNYSCLKRAIQFYDRCLTIINSSSMMLVMMNMNAYSSFSSYGKAIMVAAANNKAHIHYFELKNFMTSQRELNHAVCLLHKLDNLNPPPYAICHNRLVDVNEIIVNAIVYCLSPCAPSA